MNAEITDYLPTREEIADDSLDGRYAVKHFHGKTLMEAEDLFAQGCRDYIPLAYPEDLLWMKPVGFRFYIRAAIRFCLSERATGECDVVSSMAGTLSLWDEQHPGKLIRCAHLLVDFCRVVVKQFDRYDADREIDAGLREQY